MRRLHTKALSVLLSVALVLSSLPAPAIAQMAEDASSVESSFAPAASGDMGETPAPEAEAPSDGADGFAPAVQHETSAASASPSQPTPQETPEPTSGEGDERTVSASLEQEAVDMPAGATNDELFATYAQQLIDESISGDAAEGGVRLGTQSAEDGLMGPNLVCYDKLKTMARSVAAGSVTKAAVEVTCSELVKIHSSHAWVPPRRKS